MTPEEREQSRRDYLAEAIAVLNRSLDVQDTLTALARLAVPRIADFCAVDLVEDGRVKRLAVAHADPEIAALARDMMDRYGPLEEGGAGRAVRTGRPELITEVTDAMRVAVARDAEQLAQIRRIGLRAMMTVPLRRGDRTIGAITLGMAGSGRGYDANDLATATALADRASTAIENALLFHELERAHAHTADERDRLVQLVEAAPVAIAVLRGPDLVFDVVNELFEATFGGRKLRGLPQAVLDPTGEHARTLRRVLATGERMAEHERAVTYDWSGAGAPETRYFDLTMAPLRDAAGAAIGVVSFSIDVTATVVARHRLEEARAAAELASRTKDEFLAMLGHELRNPLAPILTALELMALRDPTALQRERAVIERQVRHVVRLVDDLLDVSRITRSGVELHREPLDLADVVAKGIELATPLLEDRAHELVVEVPRGLVVDGDPVRLAQVAGNLLTNAARYTPPRGTITVRGERDGAQVVLRVRDTGIGMDAAMLPHVFEVFYQGRQPIDRARGGLGLGLAIVKTMVTAHGGTVEARSEGADRGSELIVRLPARPPTSAAASAPPPEPAARPPRRAETVLIVDDNADALALLGDALERRGWRTLRAADAPAALAMAAHERPDIALLDIGLPVMDGYELGRRLRALPGLAAIRLVAVTGYGQASDLERSRAAGFAAHLVKPIAIARVQATLEGLAPGPSTPESP